MERFLKYFALAFMLLMASCGERKSNPKDSKKIDSADLSAPGFILEKKISAEDISDIEHLLQSKKGKNDFSYIRLLKSGIPMGVTYFVSDDSVSSVNYHLGNLPKRKHEIESFLTELIELLEKRFGKNPTIVLDKRRKDITTRIDFMDHYYWNKKSEHLYEALIDYEDSGRAGETKLSFTLRFW